MRFMQTESVLQTKNRSGPAKNRFSVALPLGASDVPMHYCSWPSASGNSASGRPRHLGAIVLTIH